MSDVTPLSGISGLSFDSTLLPTLLLFSLSLLLFLSYLFFSACWSILLNFSQKILQYFSLRDTLFCMVSVQQLGEVSWSVVCAACDHMALVFFFYSFMQLFFVFFKLLLSIHFSYFFFQTGIVNQLNSPQYQRVLALCAF